MPIHFYAFEYNHTKSTPLGPPNPHTGHSSIDGILKCFTSFGERRAWVRGKREKREYLPVHEIKDLFRGMTREAVFDMLSIMRYEADLKLTDTK